MRPTVEEQLLGTCRILQSVVAPCVTEPYARTMLNGLIANLQMLAGALPAVPRFLADDNRDTTVLLAQLQAVAEPALAADIARALGAAEPDAADTASLDRRNADLRELLARALTASGLTPELRAMAIGHMAARASRSPMRYVSTASTPDKAS